MNKHIAPIILATAMVLLALGAAGLAYEYPSSVSDTVALSDMTPKGKASKKLKAEELQVSLEAWNTPLMWNDPPSHHPMFDSIKYLFFPSQYPGGDYLKVFDANVRSPGGVLLSWYVAHNIEITSATVDREDPDGDGFSNLTEFKNEKVGEHLQAADCDGTKSTNPSDAQSHPDYLARLRLQKYERIPFHLRFNSYDQLNGKYVFQINFTDLSSDKQPVLKHMGDPLGIGTYVIGEFKQNIVDEMDKTTRHIAKVDRSTLEIIRPEIDLHIILPLKDTIDSPESTANFVMVLPSEADKVLKVPVGKILTVTPFLANTDFLVLSVNDDGAKIRDTKTKQEYLIPKLMPADWDEAPLPPSSGAPKNP